MGRILDLIFPERVYRREQRERAEAQLNDNGAKLSELRTLIIRTEAVRGKRGKVTEEVLVKILERIERVDQKIDKLDQRLDAIEKKLTEGAANGTLPGGVSPKQLLSEYLFGENGDE